MARVTIEDCLLYIPNRFKIVELAANRAREIANGARTTVEGESASSHKVTVLALREIASGKLDEKTQKNDFSEFDLFEEDLDEAMARDALTNASISDDIALFPEDKEDSGE